MGMNEFFMGAAAQEKEQSGKKEPLWKRALRPLVSCLLVAVLTTVFFIARNGVPLLGVPKPDQVMSVRVEFLESGKVREVTDPEQIELAVKLLNHLNYQVFTPVSENSEALGPDVTITYVLKDGRELDAGANWITGWWKGQTYALKEPDLFVNLAEGVFLR